MVSGACFAVVVVALGPIGPNQPISLGMGTGSEPGRGSVRVVDWAVLPPEGCVMCHFAIFG
jgi:hypothetical protein